MAKCSSFLDCFGLSAVANNISSFVGDHKIGSVGGRKIIQGRTRDKEDVEQRPMQLRFTFCSQDGLDDTYTVK